MTLQTRLDGNVIQSGSIPVSAISNFTGELSASLPSGVVSSSLQVKNNLPADTVSSSLQVTVFLPTNTVSSSTQVTAFLPVGSVSSSTQVDFGTISNKPTLVSSSGQINVFSTIGGDSLATTGSNTFTGVTAFSDTTNSTNYLNGSVTVAGGMSIQKDLRISGSMTINGLLTVVSMSSQYVTSSQYNVGVSKITLNDDDNVRFAGLSVVDSGSSSPATASIYWDSLQHRFIYENLSGSAYNSAIIIAGPKNTGSLGNETELTTGYIPYATGGDHIDNSVIFQSGNKIGIGTTNANSLLYVYNNTVWTAANLAEATSSNMAFKIRTRSGQNSEIVMGAFGADAAGVQALSNSNAVALQFLINPFGGNVGIGTTIPGNKLHVYGENPALFESGLVENSIITVKSGTTAGSGAIAGIQFQNGSGSAIPSMYAFNNTGALVVETSGVARLYISSSGNVGIGNVTPTAKLMVEGAGGSFNSTIYGYSTVADMGLSLFSANNSGTPSLRLANGLYSHRIWLAGDGSGDLNFAADWQNTVPRVVFDGDGNVGIGSTNPVYKLDVSGSGRFIGNEPIVTNATTGNYSVIAHQYNGVTRAFSGYNSGFAIYGGEANTDTRIQAGGAYIMTLLSGSGNVGVGTTAPAYKLEVWGGIRSISSGGNPLILLTTSGVANRALTMPAGTSRLSILKSDLATEQVTILDDGNVGIGATNPRGPLQIGSAGGSVMNWIYFNNNVGSQAPSLITGLAMGWNYTNGHGEALITYGIGDGTTGGGTYRRLSLADWNGSTLTERLTVYNGNVGIGITTPKYKLDVNGVIQGNVHLIPDTGASAQWVKIGTLGAPQNGYTARIRAYIHSGYNADNAQDFAVEIFFKTSNSNSVDGNGFAGNSWYYTTGLNLWNPTVKWKANAAGVNATAYDLYLYLPNYSFASSYAVDLVDGIAWTNVGATGQSDPGAGSSTVCIASLGFNIPIGNVGIGVTNPGATLDVNGSIRLSDSGRLEGRGFPYNTTVGSGADATTTYIDAGSTNGFLSRIALAGGNATDPNTIKLFTTSTERIRIDSSGNVGIGITNPVHPLQVRRGGAAASLGINIDNIGSIAELARSVLYYAIGDSTSDRTGHVFYTRNTTATDYIRMVINSIGRVGIGTNEPATPLHIDGVASSDSVYTGLIGQSSTNTAYYNVVRWIQGASGTAVGMIGTGGSTASNTAFQNTFVVGTQNATALVLASNDTERVRITSDGAIVTTVSSELSVTKGINSSTTTGFVDVILDGNVFGAEVLVSISSSDGYAGRVVKYLWWARRATGGNSRGIVELHNESMGSVNAGVITVPTLTATATNPSGNVERFNLSFTGGTDPSYIYVNVRPVGYGVAIKTLKPV